MNIRIIAIALLLIALPVSAQKKKTVVNAGSKIIQKVGSNRN